MARGAGVGRLRGFSGGHIPEEVFAVQLCTSGLEAGTPPAERWFCRVHTAEGGGRAECHWCTTKPVTKAIGSYPELHAPFFDDKTWFSEAQSSGRGANGVTLCNNKVAAFGEDGETAPLSTDCLQEDLSSSDDDDFPWESLEPTKCPQAFTAGAFASELEEWNFDMEMAKHFEEVNEDVASHAASQPKWNSRAKLSWRKTQTGRRRARRVGSGVTRSSLPIVEEEKACDAFLERLKITERPEPDDFERRARWTHHLYKHSAFFT
eukprot:825674-Amphidinium_carterae.2